MIKNVNGRFDDSSVSPKIRQTLLHWDYELVENYFLRFIFWPKRFKISFVYTKISFVHVKKIIIGLIDKNHCKKQMIDIIIVEEKKKLVKMILKIKNF